MKTKDLVYIGVIGILAYLLLKNKSTPEITQDTNSNGNNPPAGNSSNGGLNLGKNMDLPNLTPTSPNGMSTETALNSSNVTPLVKDDNEPTQIFGALLPPELQQSGGTSNINTNPIDVVNNQSDTSLNNSDEPTQVFGNYDLPTPYGTSTINSNPLDVIPTYTNTTSTSNSSASTSPRPQVSTSPMPRAVTTPSAEVEVSDNSVVIMPRPVSPTTNGTSVIDFNPLDVVPTSTSNSSASTSPRPQVSTSPRPQVSTSPRPQVSTTPRAEVEVFTEPMKDTLISECGNSFSIPNNDKEGSYTNYWFDGINFYMQTTSPYIKTIPNKITKDLFFDGCKKLKAYKQQNTMS